MFLKKISIKSYFSLFSLSLRRVFHYNNVLLSRYKNIKQQTDIIYNEKIVFGFRTLVANFQWVCYGTKHCGEGA